MHSVVRQVVSATCCWLLSLPAAEADLSLALRLPPPFPSYLAQFDDEFVKAHFPKFESAEEMKRSLVATTAMERLKALDQELADAVMQVGLCAWGDDLEGWCEDGCKHARRRDVW